MSDDFRLPPVPGADALPEWRKNPAYADIGLSPESVAALDESEQQEQEMAERLRELTAANREAIIGANAALEARHAEQLRTDALTDDELRAELTDAIDNHSLARRQVADAEHIVERASDAIASTEARLARFAGLDERIAAFNADRLRTGQLTGLPIDLIEQRRERADVTELLEVTRAAYIALACELQTAKLNLEDTSRARDQAAVAVITRYCDSIATDIEQTQERLHDLRQQLLSVSAVWLPLAGEARSLPVSDKVRAALRRNEERPLSNEETKSAARQWFIELQTDPNATIGGVE